MDTNKKSIWKQADDFLSMTRKILVNGITALILIVITFSFIGGIVGSFGDASEEITSEDKVLWFKPIGVVVDTEVINTDSFTIEDVLGGTSIEQHQLQDLLDVLNHAADDEDLLAVYVNVSELGMYWASAFKIAEAVKNVRESGKRVIAYAETFSNRSYLISSQANEV